MLQDSPSLYNTLLSPQHPLESTALLGLQENGGGDD